MKVWKVPEVCYLREWQSLELKMIADPHRRHRRPGRGSMNMRSTEILRLMLYADVVYGKVVTQYAEQNLCTGVTLFIFRK